MEPMAFVMTSGLALGFASSVHCAGMCGAITASLMLASGPKTGWNNARIVVLTHFGRISAYALAGALIGALGAPAVGWLDRELAFRVIQWAGAVVLMWIGLSTAGLLPPLAGVDGVLLPISRRVASAVKPVSGPYAAPIAAGIAWGLMPCVMVYGALFTAMLTGSAIAGAAAMVAFGVGTLPALLAAAAGFHALSQAAIRRRLRVTTGLTIACLGALTVWAPHVSINVLCAQELTQR
jgi:sulfite exporter TauE/SafE